VEQDKKERLVLKIIQISDLHITKHRDLLAPMISAINNEPVDLVVVTGDVVHESTKELLQIARNDLNQIRHKVVVIPGDYDKGELWNEYFGKSRLNSINLNGYCLDFVDTSFMRHRFFDGWSDVIKTEDPEQYAWLKEQLKIDKYHIIFSHHPFWVTPKKEGDEFLTDNVRALYSGHLHEPSKVYFKYDKPRRHFPNGYMLTPLKFHGNSCYVVILVKDNDEIVNIPRVVTPKRTAW